MSLPKIVTREEWLVARKELLAREKQFDHERDELTEARRSLPMVRVEKEYVFEGPQGAVSLRELFEGRRQLSMYHLLDRTPLGRQEDKGNSMAAGEDSWIRYHDAYGGEGNGTEACHHG